MWDFKPVTIFVYEGLHQVCGRGPYSRGSGGRSQELNFPSGLSKELLWSPSNLKAKTRGSPAVPGKVSETLVEPQLADPLSTSLALTAELQVLTLTLK